MSTFVAALLRHAEYRQLAHTPSAHQPFPLTPAGRQQALVAAAGLQQAAAQHGWKIASEVHSSQLLRAWETASIIARALDGDCSVSAFAELAERSVGSCAANLTVAQIEAVVRADPRFEPLPPDWKSSSEFCLPLPGAESLLQAGERVAQHLEATMQQLQREAGEATLKVFVGHGAALRHAAYALGILEYADIARLSMYHAGPVYIEYRQGAWKQVAGRWKVRGAAVGMD